jgi:hypothetical protein
MSFMDIMNIMKVSSSKFTFTLIAIAALFVGGLGFLAQDVYAGNGGGTDIGFDAPEFTCNHINTTATHCTFDQPVNGTLAVADWGIRTLTTATAGDITYDYAISNIANASSTGVGLTAPSAGDIAISTLSTSPNEVAGLGFLNGTHFVLIHAAIPSYATYYINYTNNPSATGNQTTAGGSGAFHSSGQIASAEHKLGGEGSTNNKMLKIGSNATAKDWMVPTAVSAEVLESNAKQIRILMSENIANVNGTLADFTLARTSGLGAGSGGEYGYDFQSTILTAYNGSSYIYVNLQKPVATGDVLTILYNPGLASAGVGVEHWITDAIDSTRYANSGVLDTDEWLASGHGNRLANFTALSITNWIQLGFDWDGTSNCYDCSAPTVSAVQVSLDGSTPVTVTDDNAVQINAGIGDTVSVMVTVADNVGADTMTFAGLYTNFGDAPDNLYYSNNFDSFKSMSTSYYEWNARADDTAFGNTDAITWDEATATINPDRTQTITYTMTINDSIESSQVWVDLGDMSNNYGKSALPITLEVAGPPALTFASDDSQKVVSYFNESILLAIVSQWTATSSDDATNVEQLSSVLGIEDQLPTWTTSLASWVSDDKIDVADMIVAVEYVINQ